MSDQNIVRHALRQVKAFGLEDELAQELIREQVTPRMVKVGDPIEPRSGVDWLTGLDVETRRRLFDRVAESLISIGALESFHVEGDTPNSLGRRVIEAARRVTGPDYIHRGSLRTERVDPRSRTWMTPGTPPIAYPDTREQQLAWLRANGDAVRSALGMGRVGSPLRPSILDDPPRHWMRGQRRDGQAVVACGAPLDLERSSTRSVPMAPWVTCPECIRIHSIDPRFPLHEEWAAPTPA